MIGHRLLWAASLSAALACAALAASCSSSTNKGPHPTTSTSTAVPLPPGPLTGLPVSDVSILSRPAVIVKVDNAPQARPQAGIDRADVVIEEKVEGGVARFMAVFQSQDAPLVGPVRSVRSTDPNVVRPIGGLFAYSGGIAPFIALLHSNGGVVDVGYDAYTRAYHWRDDRPNPHNLYTSTAELRLGMKPGMGPPRPLFTYLPNGAPFTGAGVADAGSLRVALGGQEVGEWKWDLSKQSWLRTTDGTLHVVEGGAQIAVTTVIIQFVPYSRTKYTDPSHSPVDQADVVGSGQAWVLADGRIIKGTWTKPAATDVTNFTDSAGAPIAIPPGHTWVTLAPVGASAQAS